MRKKCALWADFYRGSCFSAVLLALVMSAALLSVTYAVGFLRFLDYTKNLYQNAGLQNAVYYMLNQEYQMNIFERPQEIEEIYQKAEALPGVERVVRSQNGSAVYHGVPCSVSIYDDFMKQAFPLRLSGGSWFEQASEADGLPPVVVGGDLFSDVRVGDVLPLKLRMVGVQTMETQQITARVVGKIRSPSYIFSLGISGDYIKTHEFLQVADMVIFEEGESLPPLLQQSGAQITAANAFIVFSPDAADHEKEEAFAYLVQNGSLTTYDEIMQSTNAYIADQVKKRGMLPFFLLFVATMSLISVSVMLVYKKMESHSIYYLCGCSRRRSFAQMFAGIAGIACLAGIMNIIIILLYPYLYSHGILDLGSVVIDEYSILYIILYLVVVSLLSAILPYLVFRKSSPIDFYRRKES